MPGDLSPVRLLDLFPNPHHKNARGECPGLAESLYHILTGEHQQELMLEWPHHATRTQVRVGDIQKFELRPGSFRVEIYRGLPVNSLEDMTRPRKKPHMMTVSRAVPESFIMSESWRSSSAGDEQPLSGYLDRVADVNVKCDRGVIFFKCDPASEKHCPPQSWSLAAPAISEPML